jgi:hypothetical protein
MSEKQTCPTCGMDLGQLPAGTLSTGEFPAFRPADLARHLFPSPSGTPAAAPGLVTCSWCAKPKDAVRKLVTGPNVFICDECIALCVTILREDLGATWPD